jgi:hypothetical protein
MGWKLAARLQHGQKQEENFQERQSQEKGQDYHHGPSSKEDDAEFDGADEFSSRRSVTSSDQFWNLPVPTRA